MGRGLPHQTWQCSTLCNAVVGLSHLSVLLPTGLLQWLLKGNLPDFPFCKPCCRDFPDLCASLHVFIEDKVEMESPGQSMCRLLLASRGLNLVCPDTSGEILEVVGIYPGPGGPMELGVGEAGTLKALPRPLSLLRWSPAAVQGCPALQSRGVIPHTAGCPWLMSTFWNRAQPAVGKERRQAEKGDGPGSLLTHTF